MKKEIRTENAPLPAGPYSQAIVSGEFCFVAGQRPEDPQTKEISADVSEQARQCLKNIEGILKAAGFSLDDVVKTGIYVSDLKNFAAVNEVYQEFFQPPYPARTTVEAGLRGIDVEIDVIARK